MKIFHLSDLHLGKRIYEFSLIADQTEILTQILNAASKEHPDVVLLAGDIYDKAVPSAESVALFDWFLTELSKTTLHIFVLSGNHDSPERIAFGGNLLSKTGIHLSPVYHGESVPVSLSDSFGTLNIYALPFVKPAQVRPFFPDEQIGDYSDAMSVMIRKMQIDESARNLLIAHQFVTGATRCESEEMPVGGLDQVNASVFAPFDYVALGHIHSPQSVERPTIRYCGTPLPYSFSESNDQKSITVLDWQEKGNLTIRTLPLTPLHAMREMRGSYMDLMSKKYYETLSLTDFYHITLTDEQDVPDAIGKLRLVYSNLLKLDYDNARTRSDQQLESCESLEKANPLDLFSKFYEQQNNSPLSESQTKILTELIDQIWRES